MSTCSQRSSDIRSHSKSCGSKNTSKTSKNRLQSRVEASLPGLVTVDALNEGLSLMLPVLAGQQAVGLSGLRDSAFVKVHKMLILGFRVEIF